MVVMTLQEVIEVLQAYQRNAELEISCLRNKDYAPYKPPDLWSLLATIGADRYVREKPEPRTVYLMELLSGELGAIAHDDDGAIRLHADGYKVVELREVLGDSPAQPVERKPRIVYFRLLSTGILDEVVLSADHPARLCTSDTFVPFIELMPGDSATPGADYTAGGGTRYIVERPGGELANFAQSYREAHRWCAQSNRFRDGGHKVIAFREMQRDTPAQPVERKPRIVYFRLLPTGMLDDAVLFAGHPPHSRAADVLVPFEELIPGRDCPHSEAYKEAARTRYVAELPSGALARHAQQYTTAHAWCREANRLAGDGHKVIAFREKL